MSDESYREALLEVRDGKFPRDGVNVAYMIVDKHAEVSLLPRRWYNMCGRGSGIRLGKERYRIRLLDAGKALLRAFGEDDEKS